jgi:hypothetical protein
MDAALRQPQTLRDLALTPVLVEGEAQHFQDATHRYPFGRHDSPEKWMGEIAPGGGSRGPRR